MPDHAGKSTDIKAQSAPAHALPGGPAPLPRPAKIVTVGKSGAVATAPGPPPVAAAATDGGAALAAGTAAAPPSAQAPKKIPEHALPGSFGAPGGETAPAVEGTLIGSLDADERIRESSQQGERTLWASAILVTFLYMSLIAGHVLLSDPLSQAAQEERERMRRGQDADSISVEIVPEPDKTSKTKRWQEGTQTQGPTPNEQPPQPQQQASLAQPEVPEVEKQEQDAPKETDKPRSEDAPMLLDIDSLVDAAASDFKRNLEHALAKKPQKQRREQQATLSGGGMQVRGKGASGKSDAFSRTVIAALMKTRPGPFALWGRVLVSFQISPSGNLNYVHLLHSSGNDALDKAAINAIHKARFQRPPPGLTNDERTYIIDYIFG